MGRKHKYTLGSVDIDTTKGGDAGIQLSKVEKGNEDQKDVPKEDAFTGGGDSGITSMVICIIVLVAILLVVVIVAATLGALGYLNILKPQIKPTTPPQINMTTEVPEMTSSKATTKVISIVPTTAKPSTEIPEMTSSKATTKVISIVPTSAKPSTEIPEMTSSEATTKIISIVPTTARSSTSTQASLTPPSTPSKTTPSPSTPSPSTISPPTTVVDGSTKGPTTPPPTTHTQTTVARETTTIVEVTTVEGPTQKYPPSPYDYGEVLHKSILFFETQRSGPLPANNRIPYRGDSAIDDQGENGEDLTGGWYDAGDHLKVTFTMAYALNVLSWGFLQYKDAYIAAGEYDIFLDSVKWPLDFLLKAHTIPGEELYVQVGSTSDDHQYWGRPEEMTMDRPAYKINTTNPASDVTGETAAAFALGYLVFKDEDSTYATTLLENARQMYTFATTYRGLLSDALPGTIYATADYGDELGLAAAWMYKATGEQTYLDDTLAFYDEFTLKKTQRTLSWDTKAAAVQMLLYNITEGNAYKNKIEKYLDKWLPGGGVPRVFDDQLAVYLDWGGLRYNAATCFMALVAADMGIKTEEYRELAISQIDVMLGSANRSYVTGFGENPPVSPHHRSSSCPDPPTRCSWNYFRSTDPNPQTLEGALVGGPDRTGHYDDARGNHELNEVALDYNAGFQSALAGMINLELIGERKGLT